jgi:alpha/beta superfamily hydrolase
MEAERLTVPAPHGSLEALLHVPQSPRAAAIVCHPHPLKGGTMGNIVVHRIARALYGAGVVALRFNFRGVGLSTGAYGGGVGEQQDASAALDLLASRFPSLPLWVSGFSFGSRVGLEVGAREARVERLLGVGLALSLYDYGFLAGCPKPKAFIQADGDEFGGEPAVRNLFDRMPGLKLLRIVPQATHLFTGRIEPLENALEDAVAFLGS